MACNVIDARGAESDIYIEKDTKLNITLTFRDADGTVIDIAQFDDIQMIVATTPTVTVYSKDDGDMSVVNNALITDFQVNIAVGNYDYQLVMTTATGNIQYMYGKMKVS